MGMKAKAPPCQCDRLRFPHRRDWRCDAYADEMERAAREDEADMWREWAADRRQELPYVNGEKQ